MNNCAPIVFILNMIAGAYNLNAYPNLTSDPDDFIRNQELVEEPDAKGEFTRGFAFRVAEKFRGVDGKFEGGRLMWGGRAIPSRTIAINYAGPPGTFPIISLSDFIDAARAGRKDQIRQWVGGKAVLLGPDTSTEDRHPTPFYTAFSGLKYNTAGVEIHANTLKTLLDGDYLIPVSEPVRILSLTGVALATAVLAVYLAGWQTALFLTLAVAATAALTHLAFRGGVLFSTSELLLACLISLLASMAHRFLTAEKRGALVSTPIDEILITCPDFFRCIAGKTASVSRNAPK